MVPYFDIALITDIAVQAGKAIMEVYQLEDFSGIIDIKADKSPLTLADKKANELIVASLEKYYPAIPIISEEGKTLPFETRRDWNTFWLVDPLDGTKEFINRNGEFTVNIALIHETRPVFGCIYIPVADMLYFGGETNGAFKVTNGTSAPIYVSARQSDLISIGSRSHASVREKDILLGYAVKTFLTAGSSLKFCRIAEGAADIYYRDGPTMEWDIAAGNAIVLAAGGKVLDMEGLPFRYNKKDLLNSSFICLGTQDYNPKKIEK